ncbi:MAG: nucleotidyltransferase family protein [Candidatus Micrarchaeota archaeon]
MREKIAFSIESALLKKVDSLVDGENVKSRSHSIEILLRKALGERKMNSALILAGGGRGKIYTTPKPLLEVDEKPVLQRIIEWLARSEITKIIIAVRKGEAEVESYFGDGSNFGVEISYIREAEPRGTAGAVNLVKARFKDMRFMVLNSDVLSHFEIGDMLEFHKSAKTVATMALKEVEEPSKYGVVKLEGSRVIGFVEKPARGKEQSNLVNAGVYIFEPEIFHFIPEKGMLESEVFPVLAKKQLLGGYVFSGEWKDASRSNE